MTDLAKSYNDRWNQLKAMVASRHSRIQESITEFDTSNIMDTSKLCGLAAIKDTVKLVIQDISNIYTRIIYTLTYCCCKKPVVAMKMFSIVSYPQ